MTQSELRGEVRLKAAIIDRLFDRAHIDDDAVLISEMTVANWSRRADVVLANGALWAFEVKSELDSLTRLPGQLDAFTAHFEKVCVVCAPRFEIGARALLPEGVGLWVAEDDGSLRERVRPRYTRLTKTAAVGLMKANELRALLSCSGFTGIADAPRSSLVELAMQLPASDLASAARAAVKRRHRPRHDAFVKHRENLGTMGSMWMLRREDRPAVARTEPAVTPPAPLPEVAIPAAHPLLVNAPGGPVLKRLVAA